MPRKSGNTLRSPFSRQQVLPMTLLVSALELRLDVLFLKELQSLLTRLLNTDTTHRYHAKEIARDLNIRQYDAIVSISGDGVLHEVVNGLMERPDAVVAHKLPLGAIPAGK